MEFHKKKKKKKKKNIKNTCNRWDVLMSIILIKLILSSLQLVLCRVAAENRLPVHHHSAYSIFSGPFGIIGLILSQFENSVPLKPMLGGMGCVAPLYYCTCTDSIKATLLFCFFDTFLATKGSSFRNYFIFTAAGDVPFGGRKTSPRTPL